MNEISATSCVSSVSRADGIFFPAMAIALCLTVFAGFARTFYLRAPDASPALNPLLMVHGILFTSWMVLLLLQTLLISFRRAHWHRTMGVAGLALAVSMIVLGIATQVVRTRRVMLDGSYAAHPLLENVLLVVAIVSMGLFATFVGSAILFRRKPEAHKRLMIMATVALTGAAVVRLPGLDSIPPPLAPVLPLLFLVPLVLYDLLWYGRIFRATRIGAALMVVSTPLIPVLSSTAAVTQLARWLAG